MVQTYRQGGGSRPDVLLLELDSHQAVLKDHNACDRLFGAMLGPLLASREARALRSLEGIAGVPSLYTRVGRRCLLMEHIPGTQLIRCGDNPAWEEFFARLQGLLRDMHTRGVAHCDLRSPTNTLVCVGNRPAVVDFVSCVFRGGRWNPLMSWVFGKFRDADRAAVIKLKLQVAPQLVTAAEARSLRHRSIVERIARWIGAAVRNASRWLLTERTK